ncbi:hypothetical protein EYF80_050123 [Liparis tanakae]|uniref:Uncharacterized protein n=1 Tax=Liparis tanakae TaxID=230148 RepID=A0A4Z2FES4_9TELE|nr:hypothetical protein EYF80_050123 [Liparis tanakae]
MSCCRHDTQTKVNQQQIEGVIWVPLPGLLHDGPQLISSLQAFPSRPPAPHRNPCSVVHAGRCPGAVALTSAPFL